MCGVAAYAAVEDWRGSGTAVVMRSKGCQQPAAIGMIQITMGHDDSRALTSHGVTTPGIVIVITHRP